VVILLYHRIGRDGAEIELPRETFGRHLEHLAQREQVLSLDEALTERDGGGVVLTFDDGYQDFHQQVVPLLLTYGLPATLYLATGLVGGEAGGDGVDRLSWSDLQEAMLTELVTVGAHTHTHGDLSRATESEAEEEMRRSKELIEDRLGVSCRHFAYPFAVGSPGAQRAARKLFDSAALDAWRTNRRGRLDPFRLGRTPVLRSDGQLFFRAKVRGFLDAEGLLYRALGRGPWRYG
jgi:peptidoglycan/xylan/chitin deacetylase (PgdA/CDA1 family)